MQSLRESVIRFENLTEFGEQTKWMRRPNTIRSVRESLVVDAAFARVFLSLMLIHKEKATMLGENDTIDRVLGELASNLRDTVLRESSPASASEVRERTERAKVMFDAWKTRDKDRVVEFLKSQCVSRPPSQGADDGTNIERETMLRWIEDLAGPEARANTEARCDRRWARVRADDLPSFIQETAERAYWDLLRERVESGDVEGTLFPLLRDLRSGVEALLAAAPRSRAQFQERFDVDWLLERHRNGSLSRQEVGNYAVYVAEIVQQLQAPADEEEVRAWVDDVRSYSNTASITMEEYIPYLVGFARDAAVHMRKVVRRLEDLSAQRQRAAETR